MNPDQLFQTGNYQEAIAVYEQLLTNNPDDLRSCCYLALGWLLQGNILEAQDILMSIILADFTNQEEVITAIITILDREIINQIQSSNLDSAALIYRQIQEIETNYLSTQLSIINLLNNWRQQGKQYRESRQPELARNIYQCLVKFEPEEADLWHNLALLNYELFKREEAVTAIDQAIDLNPNNFLYHYNAGLILASIKLDSRAITAYQQAINLNPQYLESYYNLGNLLFSLNQIDAAVTVYQKAIAINPNHYGSYINLGNLFMSEANILEALAVYKQAITISNDSAIYFWVVNNIRSYNYIQEAIDFAQDNAYLFPDNPLVNLEAKRILPFIYQTPAEIDYYRHRLNDFIQALLKINLQDKSTLDEAEKLLERHTNYHLHYQGKNDVEMQRQYGIFIQRVMSQKYPQFSQPKTLNNSPGKKIKVGYISYCLRNHVVGKLALGWLKNHNHDQLEIYCYYLGNHRDQVTNKFQQYSHKFSHFPDVDSLETICEQIVKDELDILVFLDLGMYPRMTQLAGLKLAPKQCVTWMHPITSGIPTIDYFISGKLLEAEKSEPHYTEQLIKLPNLSIFYQPQAIPQIQPDRSKFNLPDTAIVYLSSQFPSKYLPQYDYLFPAIATQVKEAKFVFVHPQVHQGKNELIYQKLWSRITQAFTDYHLDAQDYCLFLPTLTDVADYWNLFAVADVFLDTIGFTGFNSTLDAIESHLPVVTHCGEFFRTRQSSGILTMLRLTETIATQESEYLDLAIKLGADSQWRTEIVTKIKNNLSLIYRDLEAVHSLENFYLQCQSEEAR